MNDKWTVGAAECYERGCICEGCPTQLESCKCQMKLSVLELVRKFGKPPKKLVGKLTGDICNNLI